MSTAKSIIKLLFNGIQAFYPKIAQKIFALPKKEYGHLEEWEGWKRPDFLEFAFNETETKDIEQAAIVVKRWQQTGAPERSTPEKEKLDQMVAEYEKKKAEYEKRSFAKELLLTSQKTAEKAAAGVLPKAETAVSTAEVITKAAGPISVFTGKMLTLPFRAAVYFSGPTVHSSKAEGEGPSVAAARYMLSHGIKSSSLLSLESVAQKAGITPNQLRKLVELIKTEEKAHPFANKWIAIVYSSRKAQLSQAQIVSLLIPSPDKTMAVLPRKSLLGNLFGQVGQQLFGKVTSKILKTATKKVAEKAAAAVVTKAAAQAAVTAVAPGIGNLLLAAGQAILGKIKDFISSLKGKKGRENILALISGSMVLGGLFIGGSVGGLLVLGGTVPALGLLASKAGGVGQLGTSIGSYGQAFVAGLTSVVLPAIGAPLIIALVSIPVLIAIIIFIINSGAYIVPPRSPRFTGIVESPYIGVEKTATPDCLNRSGCPNLPNKVTYNIKVTAKKGSLTNIKFENSYRVLGEGSDSPFPSVPDLDTPETISPMEPYIFSYALSFGEELDDSIVIDTLKVTADASENPGATASDVASVIIGDPPASSCPILGGAISTGSYDGDAETGHGSNSYWGGPAGAPCNFSIPAFSGCRGPTSQVDPDQNNICFGRSLACNHYGFAADVPGHRGDPVFLPSIFGETLNWELRGGPISNRGGSWGYGYVYKSGKYSIYLGHLNRTTPPSSAPSGTIIGTLYSLDAPHVHIELQIDGQWVRPDFLCGGVGP